MTLRHPLRWGILATGGIARAFVQDAQLAGLNIVAVGSRSAESAQRFAAEFTIPRSYGSYEQLAADAEVDIIYIATPHPMHYANALLAIQHGKHALVEKPFTLNKSEAQQLKRAAQSAGVLVTEAMWTRYLPHMVRIREIIAAGGIGEVRAVFADHMQHLDEDPEHRINSLALGGGALLDLGVYPVSLAWSILGAPESIQASGRLGPTGADTDVAVVMRHAGDALSTLMASSRAAGHNTAHIVGTTGRIDIDRVWFTSAGFTHYDAAGAVVEEFTPDIQGRGMQFQAIAAEEYVACGNFDGELITLTDSVEIMGTLDEIRRQIGVVYPGEEPSLG
ncbi:Gfo/Idh/MocA family oxidoreductase [Nesterenkonia rhizosphaerae]|uniref:Gfo/Idh/MocA family oxidoreductase n=1 Tax=Nesterenkonia rhizosphaerae TaxID=1348272 RepID=A0ABP9FP65_9MICC